MSSCWSCLVYSEIKRDISRKYYSPNVYVPFGFWHETSVCCLSVVCDVVARYPEGCTSRQYFCTVMSLKLCQAALQLSDRFAVSNALSLDLCCCRLRSRLSWHVLTMAVQHWLVLVDGWRARLQSVLHAAVAAARLIYSKRKYSLRAHNATAQGTALVVCTWAHSVQTCGARFPLSPWYCSAIPCWPAAAGDSVGVMQKATIFGLSQTGHPEGTTVYYRWPCILCRRSSCVEQSVIIDAECTFIACI